MGKLITLVVLVALGYWLWTGYSEKYEQAAAVAATATAVAATTAPSTAAAAATGAVAGAAVATGFWALLLGGGWFLGEMSFLLWCILGGIILVPLGIVGWLCELPEDQEAESGARIVGSFILFALMLFLLSWGGIPLLHTVQEHGLYLIVAFLIFVSIGVWWSVYKYGLLAKDCKDDIARAVEQFCLDMHLRVTDVLGQVDGKTTVRLGVEHKDRWEKAFSCRNTMRARLAGATAESPRIAFTNNKARITLWILFWPLSLARGFFRDILARALDKLIEALRKIYEAVAKRHAIQVMYTPAAGAPIAADEEKAERR